MLLFVGESQNVSHSVHWENYISISFHIERDMIVVTVFLSILNTNWIPFGSENRKENCHHDHIPFNVKGNGNIVFSVYTPKPTDDITSEFIHGVIQVVN